MHSAMAGNAIKIDKRGGGELGICDPTLGRQGRGSLWVV
jgi:hypothetical protein